MGSNADTPCTSSSLSSSTVHLALFLLQSTNIDSKLEGTREIRRLTKSSQQCRRHLADAINPLVSMLYLDSPICHEAALLALLNLAVKDETNKVNIVEAGALEPIVRFVQSKTTIIQERAVAALLTLSASTANKPTISASGAIPHLVQVLTSRSTQAKGDSVMALYNLSTFQDNVGVILKAKPVHALVNMLKIYKKSSRTMDKCIALLESLLSFEEGRNVLNLEEGGVLAIIEVLESGSQQGREHALGALLVMCQSDTCKYRELLLREGVIPGLLHLTINGTTESQYKARKLLNLLRSRLDLQSETLQIENVVLSIISHIDVDAQSRKAKKMVEDMVKVSMEQSLRHIQQRVLVNTCA